SVGVPYTGSNPFASSIALNKVFTKDRLRTRGVRMPRHVVFGRSSLHNMEGAARTAIEPFGPTDVVKPVASGSSVGVLIAENTLALPAVLRRALENYEQVLVEEFIAGQEATCGVVERFRGQSLYALPVVEIVPPSERSFFDYDAKYT